MPAALSTKRALGPARHHSQPPPRAPRRSAELTKVAWRPLAEMELSEWSAVGRRFGEIGRCSQWWVGDWIHYGNLKFGERYARAVKLTGYDVQSLMNMVYVASRFEVSRRRESLSWSHHAALAALDLASQERWLERAVREKLSVADLRVELRASRRALGAPPRQARAPSAGEDQSSRAFPDAAAVVCPNCGGAVPVIS
jgi:hypothetical protein